MRNKKVLSVLLASALFVTAMPFQAFATAVGSGSSSSGDIGGDSTVGSSAYLNVVVPTDLDFVINPLELDVNGDSSQIISTGYAFVNKSNMDVQLTLTPEVASSAGVTVVTSPDEITNTSGEDPTIYLELVPTERKPVMTKDPTDKFTLDSNTKFVTAGAAGATAISPTGDNNMYLKLKNLKVAYSSNGTVMTFDEAKAVPAVTDCIAFKFDGKVSQMSKWENVDLKVSVKYDFDFITKDTYDDSTNNINGAYGVIKGEASSPAFILNADGKFSITNADGYTAAGLYYMSDALPITATKASIAAAIADNTLTTGSYAIKKMTGGSSFTFDSATKLGELTSGAKGAVKGKYMIAITVLTKDGSSNSADTVYAISSNVFMN